MFSEEDVISRYSQAQAIEDGVLHLIPDEISRAYFKYPVTLSDRVFRLIEDAVADKQCLADYRGVLRNLLFACASEASSTRGECGLKALVTIGTPAMKNIHEVMMVCGPGDTLEPTITIMLPEDY